MTDQELREICEHWIELDQQLHKLGQGRDAIEHEVRGTKFPSHLITETGSILKAAESEGTNALEHHFVPSGYIVAKETTWAKPSSPTTAPDAT